MVNIAGKYYFMHWLIPSSNLVDKACKQNPKGSICASAIYDKEKDYFASLIHTWSCTFSLLFACQ